MSDSSNQIRERGAIARVGDEHARDERRGDPAEKLRVLIVDDDDDTGSLLGICLERAGFDVAVATTLKHARAELADGDFEIALVDIHLSDGDGTSLFAAGRPASLRVALVMSGARDDESRRRERGFDGYIAKPIDRLTVISTIRRMAAAQSTRGADDGRR